MFDPHTDALWYYNVKTNESQWLPPLTYKDSRGVYHKLWADRLECRWRNFLTGKVCGCRFDTVRTYQHHRVTKHKWYCPACDFKNSALMFPNCWLCGNVLDGEGQRLDVEELERQELLKVQAQSELISQRKDLEEKQQRRKERRQQLAQIEKQKEKQRKSDVEAEDKARRKMLGGGGMGGMQMMKKSTSLPALMDGGEPEQNEDGSTPASMAAAPVAQIGGLGHTRIKHECDLAFPVSQVIINRGSQPIHAASNSHTNLHL